MTGQSTPVALPGLACKASSDGFTLWVPHPKLIRPKSSVSHLVPVVGEVFQQPASRLLKNLVAAKNEE